VYLETDNKLYLNCGTYNILCKTYELGREQDPEWVILVLSPLGKCTELELKLELELELEGLGCEWENICKEEAIWFEAPESIIQ